MFEYKKITAFLMSLICITTTVTSVTAFADNEADTEIISEEITKDTQSDAPTPIDEDCIVSGDFVYSVVDEGNVCLKGCNSMETDLVIPDTIDGMPVTELSGKAFGSSPDQPYETISIPASVTYISADNPFMYCTSLKEITVSPDNTAYTSENGILYTKEKDLLICYPAEKDGNSFDIPDGVKTLGIASIYDTKLTEIKFPSSLEQIERFGIAGNLKIKSFDFSNTAVSTIGTFACSGCTLLTEVIFPENLYEIEGGAFMECSSLEEITLPDGLTYIGQCAFTSTNIKKVIVPDSVAEIGYCAFGYVDTETPMSDFVIVGSVNSAAYTYATDEDYDYDYKNDFTFITAEAYAEVSEYDALDKDIYNGFEYAVINGEAVITIYYGGEMTVEVPSEINDIPVTGIYKSAFEESTSEEIIIPESVKNIDKLAFYKCTNLKNLTIKGVETIGESAFALCNALENITISGNCTAIEGDEPFISCENLQSITVTDGNGAYSSENGVLYNKDKTILLAYPASKTDKDFKVPSGVKEISISAFYGSSYLETVDLSGVETIGAYAFEDSKSLKKAVLSDSLKTVEIYAFASCLAMDSIRVPESVETISDYSFGYKSDNTANSMTTVDGFKIYAEKDSEAYQYAEACNIEVISGTVEISGKNVVKSFLWTIGGAVAVLIAGLVGFGISRKNKKKGK